MENFQKIHGEISDKLNLAENEASESLHALGKTSEEIAAEAEEIMEKMVAPIVEALERYTEERRKGEEGSISEMLAPLVADIPKELGQTFADAILRNDEWKKAVEKDDFDTGRFFSAIISLLSENGSTSSFEFSESDFPFRPESFGTGLEEPISFVLHGSAGSLVGYTMSGGKITIEGNAGNRIGYTMSGGKITIEGNAGNRIGYTMSGGTITIKGNAGNFLGNNMAGGLVTIEGNAGDFLGHNMARGLITIEGNAGDWVGHSMTGGAITVLKNVGNWAGDQMTSGTLDIRGEVESFGHSAFLPQNKGTIIWKGAKIWENGDWTPEGKTMDEEKRIPKQA